MSNEKGVQGFTQKDFAAGTPESVFGTSDVRTEDLPQGVRLYLREKAIDLGTKRVLVNVYRLEDDGGMKEKRIWCGRMKHGRKPEDDEIAEQFGPGAYLWILKWNSPANGQECGIVSEKIIVDEEHGRIVHEEWKRRQAMAAPAAPAAPAAAPALPAAVPGVGLDALTLLKFMEAAEDKALARVERIAAIIGGRNDTPADVLRGAYEGASAMMQAAVKTNLDMARSVGKQLNRPEPEPEPEAGEGDGEPAGPQLPPWIQAFMPQIEKGLEKLLGGGPLGGAVKTLVLSSEEWAEIFADKDKFGQAVAAMEQRFGSDKTKRALDILLNRREPKDAKKGGRK